HGPRRDRRAVFGERRDRRPPTPLEVLDLPQIFAALPLCACLVGASLSAEVPLDAALRRRECLALGGEALGELGSLALVGARGSFVAGLLRQLRAQGRGARRLRDAGDGRSG